MEPKKEGKSEQKIKGRRVILIWKNSEQEQTNSVKKKKDNENYYDKSISPDNTCYLATVTLLHTRELMQNYLGMDMCLCWVVGLGQVRKKCGLCGCQWPHSIMKSTVRRARFLSTVENYISKPKPRQRTVTGFVVNKDKQENQKRNEINDKRRWGKVWCPSHFSVCFLLCFVLFFPRRSRS